MISLTFPDGAKRAFAAGTTGRDVAESICQVARQEGRRHGARRHARRPCRPDSGRRGGRDSSPATIREALELIRHDSAHVLAEAVQELWPGTQVTIGPVIENGFYYDFDRNEPFTPEDFPAIEKKMREIIARNKPFTKEVWSRDKAQERLRATRARRFKVELIDAIPEGQDIKIYAPGRLVRPLPRPAYGLDRARSATPSS